MEKFFGWRQWGIKATRALDEALSSCQDFLSMADRLGAEMSPEETEASAITLQEGGRVAAQKLARSMGLGEVENIKGPTGWRWALMKGIIEATGPFQRKKEGTQ